jgi:hypothetical protein
MKPSGRRQECGSGQIPHPLFAKTLEPPPSGPSQTEGGGLEGAPTDQTPENDRAAPPISFAHVSCVSTAFSAV